MEALQHSMLPHPVDMVLIARVRLICKIARHSPPAIKLIVVEALADKHSWASQVQRDLHRLSTQSQDDLFVKLRGAPQEKWLETIAGDKNLLTKVIKTVCGDTFRDQTLQMVAHPVRIQVGLGDYPCHLCGMHFTNSSAFNCHCMNLHGYFERLAQRIRHTVCLYCNTDHMTVSKLLNHLNDPRQTRRCGQKYLKFEPVIHDDMRLAISRWDLHRWKVTVPPGKARHDWPRPAIRCVGPILKSRHPLNDVSELQDCSEMVTSFCSGPCLCCREEFKQTDFVKTWLDTNLPSSET